MRVKYEVLGVGYTQFHSPKTNRDYQKMRLIGFVYDYDGVKEAATADLSFEGKFDREPPSGAVVVLDLVSLSRRNAMLELEFSSLVHLPEGNTKKA